MRGGLEEGGCVGSMEERKGGKGPWVEILGQT